MNVCENCDCFFEPEEGESLLYCPGCIDIINADAEDPLEDDNEYGDEPDEPEAGDD